MKKGFWGKSFEFFFDCPFLTSLLHLQGWESNWNETVNQQKSEYIVDVYKTYQFTTCKSFHSERKATCHTLQKQSILIKCMSLWIISRLSTKLSLFFSSFPADVCNFHCLSVYQKDQNIKFQLWIVRSDPYFLSNSKILTHWLEFTVSDNST